MNPKRVGGVLATAAFWALLIGFGVLLPAWMQISWTLLLLPVALASLYGAWVFSPFVPTPMAEVERLVEHLELGPGSTYYELGVGEGRLLVAIAERTGARCVGIEISPALWAIAKLRVWWAGVDASIRLGDLRQADLSGADAVYFWGSAHGIERSLIASVPAHCVVISRDYPVPGCAPIAVDTAGPVSLHIYRGPG